MDDEVKKWWSKVKDSDVWSGAIVGTEWDQKESEDGRTYEGLSDEAHEQLREIYTAAKGV